VLTASPACQNGIDVNMAQRFAPDTRQTRHFDDPALVGSYCTNVPRGTFALPAADEQTR
jgi:hypothetical protein